LGDIPWQKSEKHTKTGGDMLKINASNMPGRRSLADSASGRSGPRYRHQYAMADVNESASNESASIAEA
jgi:hypothetical protein